MELSAQKGHLGIKFPLSGALASLPLEPPQMMLTGGRAENNQSREEKSISTKC